jgi:hypothetical protein
MRHEYLSSCAVISDVHEKIQPGKKKKNPSTSSITTPITLLTFNHYQIDTRWSLTFSTAHGYYNGRLSWPVAVHVS